MCLTRETPVEALESLGRVQEQQRAVSIIAACRRKGTLQPLCVDPPTVVGNVEVRLAQ
jgi:hypothetical protein